MKKMLIWCVILFLFCNSYLNGGEVRQWKGSNGKVIEAELLSFDAETNTAKLKLKNGKESNVSLSLFSKEDQEFIKNGGSDNPFGDTDESESKATVKELDKEVLRISLKLTDNEECSYKIEKTKTAMDENFEGRTVHLFPNAKTFRDKDGMMTTIHDFKNPSTLEDLFFPKKSESKSQITLDRSSGTLVLQAGPMPNGSNWKEWCTAAYKKRSKLPIEITVDIKNIEYFNKGNDKSSPEFVFWFAGNEGTPFRRIGFAVTENTVKGEWMERDSNQNDSSRTFFTKSYKDGQAEGTFELPESGISCPFTISIRNSSNAKKMKISKLVMKGKFFDF